jgi:hypothetical protein
MATCLPKVAIEMILDYWYMHSRLLVHAQQISVIGE